MKFLLSCFFLVVYTVAMSQSVQSFESVETLSDAFQYLEAKGKGARVLQLHTIYDTNARYKPLLKGETGRIYKHDGYRFKIIKDTSARFSRVQYIYLAGSAMSRKAIDSTRNYIRQQLDNGVSFEQMIAEFNMDGGSGDTGWFTDGTMVAPFEKAMYKQKAPSIYTVDIPDRGWYYVVKKIHETKYARMVWVLEERE